jgi:hypothetical protein
MAISPVLVPLVEVLEKFPPNPLELAETPRTPMVLPVVEVACP